MEELSIDGLVIGLNLNDDYIQIRCYDKEKSWAISTVIRRGREEEVWFSEEEAHAATLLGEGVVVDRLPKMAARDGTSTIGGICYSRGTLLKLFIKKMLGYPRKELGTDETVQLIITLQSVDCRLLDTLMHCADYLEIPRDRVHAISYTKGLIYYVLSQKEELWTNQVGLFELSGERPCCYEMKVQRGAWCNVIQAEAQSQGKAFNLDILDSSSGSRLADKILTAYDEKLLSKRLFSMASLTGKDFERQSWAGGFMRLICNRRKVFVEPCLFTRGAAYKGADYTHQETLYPYVFTHEGGPKMEVSLKVMCRGRENQLVAVSYGGSWCESKGFMNLVVDGQKEIGFTISPPGSGKRRLVRAPLTGFPERLPETTRIEFKVTFTDEGVMTMSIHDKGFGELFPSFDVVARQEVKL